jgi:porin
LPPAKPGGGSGVFFAKEYCLIGTILTKLKYTKCVLLFFLSLVGVFVISAPAAAEDLVPVPDWGRTLTKDWGGARSWLSDRGVVLELDATHITQHVFDGGAKFGINGERLDDTGHTLSSEIDLKIDTEKAGLWPGGMIRFWTEMRTGNSVTTRAGSLVNYDALLPIVADRFDDEVIAINELTLTQFFSESFGVFGGLLDAAYGDENDFAGNGRSNDYFLHTYLNGNPVSFASTPDVSLGGGAIFLVNDRLQGWAGAYNSEGAAGTDPFQNNEGTTFFTEWTLHHKLGSKKGYQKLGLLYGIDRSRTDIFADPRLALQSIVSGLTLPTTDKETWAAYYSLTQYIEGNAEKGWGLFMRLGISDGDPNPIEHFASIGLGGMGIFDSRPDDRFGIGTFWTEFTDGGLVGLVGIDESYGLEMFYTFQVMPWLKITADIQVVNSALPQVDDAALVGGIRTKWEL